MCLQTTWLEPKIAQEDIIVYKEMRTVPGGYSSIIKGCFYAPKILYETKIEESKDFSSFDEIASSWRFQLRDSGISFKSIGAGFHAAKTYDRLEESGVNGQNIIQSLIPKGAEYYEDGTNLIVSNKIIIKG